MTAEELRQHQEMDALYRKEVLKEQPSAPVLQIQGLGALRRAQGGKKQDVAEVVHKSTV